MEALLFFLFIFFFCFFSPEYLSVRFLFLKITHVPRNFFWRNALCYRNISICNILKTFPTPSITLSNLLKRSNDLAQKVDPDRPSKEGKGQEESCGLFRKRMSERPSKREIQRKRNKEKKKEFREK